MVMDSKQEKKEGVAARKEMPHVGVKGIIVVICFAHAIKKDEIYLSCNLARR